jgi:hypothetical protein
MRCLFADEIRGKELQVHVHFEGTDPTVAMNIIDAHLALPLSHSIRVVQRTAAEPGPTGVLIMCTKDHPSSPSPTAEEHRGFTAPARSWALEALSRGMPFEFVVVFSEEPEVPDSE